MDKNNFSRFAAGMQALPVNTERDRRMLLWEEGKHQLYYIPFEHLNPAARLVIVGISPGPDQMKIAYNTARTSLAKGLPHDEASRRAKHAGAFGGLLRTNLCKMLDHFDIPAWLGVPTSLALFEQRQDLIYSTSVVPHAAFIGEDGLSKDFKTVLQVPAFYECFMDCFVKRIPELHPDAKFLALGHVVKDALEWCVAHGHLDRSRVLGTVPHPSGNGGSQVRIFVGEKKLDMLKPLDPVRNRVRFYREYYDGMAAQMSRLLGRPLPTSATTYANVAR